MSFKENANILHTFCILNILIFFIFTRLAQYFESLLYDQQYKTLKNDIYIIFRTTISHLYNTLTMILFSFYSFLPIKIKRRRLIIL